MKKNFLFLAAAALVFAACANENVQKDIEEEQLPIGFESYANLATRGAENSSATTAHDLAAYHTNFFVWGYKNVASTDVPVFTKQQVKYASSDWSYTPVRYWDKSANHYKFYAAAPAADAWTFNAETSTLSYADYSLTGATLAPATSIDNAAVFSTDVDLMISHDITDYSTYTAAPVNLEFDHILSRLNIGIKKDASVTDAVTLNEIKVFNMKSNGSFTENTPVAAGSNAHWGAAATPATFTSGVGFATATTLTTTENFVYQALCIPQTVETETVALDGTGLSATSKPYIKIKYTINEESFTYYYNLADIFNGAGTNNIDFFEGWQNTLHITINPIAIKFDAEVYEWVVKTSTDIKVPNA